MISHIFGADSTGARNNAISFNTIDTTSVSSTWSTTETTVDVPIPHDFTADFLYFNRVNAPSGTKSQSYALMQNGSLTALTVNIVGTSTSGSNLANTVSYVAGDTISFRGSPTGTPAVDNPRWSVRQTAPNLQAMFGISTSNVTNNVVTYNGLQAVSSWSPTESNVMGVAPTAGVIKNLFVRLSGAASAGTAHYTFALMRNGSAQALTVDIAGTATAGTDQTHSFSFIAGDTLSLRSTPAGLPTARNVAWACSFQPNNDGESIMLYGDQSQPSTTVTQYEQPQGNGADSWSSTETDRQMSTGSTTFQAMYVQVSAAPGGTASRQFTFRQNSGTTALVATITGTSVAANVTGKNIVCNPYDNIVTETIPNGTPSACTVSLGLLFFTAPLTSFSGWRNLMGVGL